MTQVHPLGNTLLRTPETFERYHNHPKRESKECFICETEMMVGASIAEYWSLIENEFPYDAVANKHMLLVPNRHVGSAAELTMLEKASLEYVLMGLNKEGKYDAIIENLDRGRTFAPHYHIHVIQWKRVPEQLL